MEGVTEAASFCRSCRVYYTALDDVFTVTLCMTALGLSMRFKHAEWWSQAAGMLTVNFYQGDSGPIQDHMLKAHHVRRLTAAVRTIKKFAYLLEEYPLRARILSF